MTRFSTPFLAHKSDSAFDDLSASLGDHRPHPSQDALSQLGRAIMTELVDLISDTALEDYQTLLCEALIGAFHLAAGRIERDADRARDAMRQLNRDFDRKQPTSNYRRRRPKPEPAMRRRRRPSSSGTPPPKPGRSRPGRSGRPGGGAGAARI